MLFFLFFLLLLLPPRSTLFPYTTLFRSVPGRPRAAALPLGRGPGGDRAGRRALPRHDPRLLRGGARRALGDRKSTRLNSSHRCISYAVFCLKKKKISTSETHGCSSLTGW